MNMQIHCIYMLYMLVVMHLFSPLYFEFLVLQHDANVDKEKLLLHIWCQAVLKDRCDQRPLSLILYAQTI